MHLYNSSYSNINFALIWIEPSENKYFDLEFQCRLHIFKPDLADFANYRRKMTSFKVARKYFYAKWTDLFRLLRLYNQLNGWRMVVDVTQEWMIDVFVAKHNFLEYPKNDLPQSGSLTVNDFVSARHTE